MSQRLAAQLSGIRAPDKLPDRLLACGTIRPESITPLKEQLVLAYLFEISKPWLPSSRLLPSIISILEEQFEKLDGNHSLDDQFEAVLRAVNLKLNEISEQGETDWIGSLNGLIVLLGKDELHFSQAGHCPTYLLQNNRIRQITDEPGDPQDSHPLKTFSNLASGQLQEGDRILISNLELYNEISLDALRRILHQHSPYQASQTIAKELRKEKNPRVCSLIIAIDKESSLHPEPVLINMAEEMESPTKKLYRALVPLAKGLGNHGKRIGSLGAAAAVKAGGVAATTVKDKVLPAASSAIQKAQSKRHASTPAPETPSQPEQGSIEIIPSKAEREAAKRSTEDAIQHEATRIESAEAEIGSIIPASEFELERPKEKSATGSQSSEKVEELKKFLTRRLPELIKVWLRSFGDWIQITRNKKITALVCALILIGAVVWGAINSKNPKQLAETGGGNVTLINQARESATKAKVAIELEQNVEASRLVEDGLKKLDEVSQPTSAQQEELTQVWQELSTSADILTKTTRLASAANQYAFPNQPQQLITNLPYFFAFQSGTDKVLRTGAGNLEQIQQSLQLPDQGEVVAAIAQSSEPDTAGYVLTKQAKVYRLVQTGSTTLIRSIKPESGDFANGDAIASYSDNVYILDGKTGLLWRYLFDGAVYSKGTMIIDVNKVDLKDSVSLGIDGSVYVLKKDGNVVKLTSGKLDSNFSLKNQPYLSKKLIRPIQIVASENLTNVYILDGGTTSSDQSSAKVMEFDKTGNFIKQYAFPKDMTDVRAFQINPKESKLWLLNGAKVYEFGI